MNYSKELVSVIITTFNRSNLLPRAVNSVLKQTYQNLEIIIVDDCSTDNTLQVIKNFSDERIKYIKNNKNLGLAASRNIGIKASKGEYISFLDDDDELLPNKVAEQIELFKNANVDVVYCGMIRKYNGKTVRLSISTFRGYILEHILVSSPSGIHSLLIKRRCLEKIGLFDETFPAFEDWDLWIRLSEKCVFDLVNKFLVIYHFYGSQMSFDLDLKIRSHELILTKHKTKLLKHKNILYWQYRKLASRLSLADKYTESLEYVIKSIKIKPINVGSYIHLLLLLCCKQIDKKLIYKFGIKKIGDKYLF